MTVAGDLNRRLVLEAPAEADDGAGGVTRLYEVVTTLWAQVVPRFWRSAAPPRTALVQLCATKSLYVHTRRSRSSTAFTTAPISTASLRCARLPTAGFSKSKSKNGTTEPFLFSHTGQSKNAYRRFSCASAPPCTMR